jgi:hypothetical protein
VAEPRFLFVCSYEGKTLSLSKAFTLSKALSLANAVGVSSAPGRVVSARLNYDHVAWRLLGANNRELGRSPIWYPDVESCREAVRALKREIGGMTTAISSVGMPGGAWSWRLVVSGTAVAVAGRPYHRQRECAYNLSHFVAAVPDARIADEPCHPARR